MAEAELPALRDLKDSPGYSILQRLIEAEAAVLTDVLIAGVDTPDFVRGQIAAHVSLHTVAERYLTQLETHYANERTRRQSDATEPDFSRHWGSSAFHDQFAATRSSKGN